MKRRSPIAKSLVKSSEAAMLAAIEIHNKPTICYRYEIVVLLIINAWELVLKGFIHNRLKKVKLFKNDGTSKPFPECVDCVFSNLGHDYTAIKENIEILYDYRNRIAHFYTGSLDPIIFMLVKKSVLFYTQFLIEFFKIDIANRSNLYLLPIGFKPLYTPVDYLSKHSASEKYPSIVRSFIDKILQVSENLQAKGIEESIISDFNISLINASRIKNADIIVGISKNPTESSRNIVINKSHCIVDENEPHQSKIAITRNKAESSGVLVHEELSDSLFKEINNIIEANKLMSPASDQFHLGEEVYYRIYAEREHVDQNIEYQTLLAKTALTKYYAPGIFWFLQLDSDSCAALILDFLSNMKNPYVHSFLRLAILLGESVSNWLNVQLDTRYEGYSQPPSYYFTYKDMLKKKDIKERRLLALRMSINQRLELPGENKVTTVRDLLGDAELASNYLSTACMNVFNGTKEDRNITRVLDILSYGKTLEEKADNIAQALHIVR